MNPEELRATDAAGYIWRSSGSAARNSGRRRSSMLEIGPPTLSPLPRNWICSH